MVQSTENARVHSPYSVPRFVVRLYGKNVRPEFHISSSQKKKKKKKKNAYYGMQFKRRMAT